MLHALLFLTLLGAPQDSVRIWATLSASAVRVGESTVLEVNVETRGAAPEAIVVPSLPAALEVAGTSDFTQLQFSLPGGRSRLVRREVVLRARAPGQFRIPPVTVRVQGVRYQTRALPLTVAAPTPRSGGALTADGPAGEVIFRSSMAPETAYVGQQVTLRSEAMISAEAQLRLRRAPEYLPPNASGFWTHDLPLPPATESRLVDGQVYQTHTFYRAYFPLSPGRYTLAPARLLYEIRRGFLYSPESQELSSDSLRVVVLPLPEAGRPASFTGAVGRYQIRARLEPAEVPIGEAVALTVEVEGEGNIKAVPPPALPAIPGVELHPPSEEAEITPVGGVVAGIKRFTWILIPREAGRLTLPAIEYAFFDPGRRSFDATRAAPLALEVRPGAGVAARGEGQETIQPLKPEPAGRSALHWIRSPWFIALQFVPLLAVIWAVLRRRRSDRPRLASRRSLRRRRRKALDALRLRVAGTGSDFFGELGELVRSWLAERLGAPALGRAAARRVGEALEAQGVSTGAARGITELLGRIERARYEPTPPGAAARVALLDEAERLLEAVDRQARAPRRSAAPAALVLLLLSLAVPGRATAAERGDYYRGIGYYRQGDFAAAARQFAGYVEDQPGDAHGWYNLGNAYHHVGEHGPAAWAWLRALRLAPRDEATRHNLRVAGVEHRLIRRTLPPLPLSTEETLLLAGLAWLFCAFGVAAFVLHRRRSLGLLAGAGLLLVLALLGGWAAPRLQGRVGVVLPGRTQLRAAPDVRAEELRALEGGAGLLLLQRRGEWIRARTLEGEEGWIEAGQVGTL